MENRLVILEERPQEREQDMPTHEMVWPEYYVAIHSWLAKKHADSQYIYGDSFHKKENQSLLYTD